MKYSKKYAKNKCACFNENIWLILMKMRVKLKNRSHRYNMKKINPRHGYGNNKYKIRLSMIMVMCNKQHLSNIWSLIHEKFTNTGAELKKKRVIFLSDCNGARSHHSLICKRTFDRLAKLTNLLSCWYKQVPIINNALI